MIYGYLNHLMYQGKVSENQRLPVVPTETNVNGNIHSHHFMALNIS